MISKINIFLICYLFLIQPEMICHIHQQISIQMQANQQQIEEAQRIQSSHDLPTSYSKRNLTDSICLLIGSGFFLLMLIITLICNFTEESLWKTKLFIDSEGHPCSNPNFPYLYFFNLTQLTNRKCVSFCPQQQGIEVQFCEHGKECLEGNKAYVINIYKTEKKETIFGNLCLPKEEIQKQKMLEDKELSSNIIQAQALFFIHLPIISSLIVSLLFTTLIQLSPEIFYKIVVYLTIFEIIGLFPFLYFTSFFSLPTKIVIALLLIPVLLAIITNIYQFELQFELQGAFLRIIANMLNSDLFYIFFYIPIFIVLTTLFILYLFFAYSSILGSNLTYQAGQLFWRANPSKFYYFFIFLLFLQAIWGLSFLKESINYLISNHIAIKYFDSQEPFYRPLQNYIFRHLGSVIGCSLMTAFFTSGDYLFDLVKPSHQKQNVSEFGKRCTEFWANIFDLVRSDSLAFISITGNSYCNASRYCQYLLDQSLILNQNQPVCRTYRLSSHLLILGVSVWMVYSEISGSLLKLMISLLISFISSAYFIAIHSEAAEALEIVFLINQEMEKRQRECTNEQFTREQFDCLNELEFKNPDLVSMLIKKKQRFILENRQ